MKRKMDTRGGMMRKQSKMYSKGGVAGGKKKPKGMSKGGKLEMVEKGGKMVPFFAADGEGKMMHGGVVPTSKGYFKGGRVMENTSPTGKPIPYSPQPGGRPDKPSRGGKRRGGRG